MLLELPPPRPPLLPPRPRLPPLPRPRPPDQVSRERARSACSTAARSSDAAFSGARVAARTVAMQRSRRNHVYCEAQARARNGRATGEGRIRTRALRRIHDEVGALTEPVPCLRHFFVALRKRDRCVASLATTHCYNYNTEATSRDATDGMQSYSQHATLCSLCALTNAVIPRMRGTKGVYREQARYTWTSPNA